MREERWGGVMGEGSCSQYVASVVYERVVDRLHNTMLFGGPNV